MSSSRPIVRVMFRVAGGRRLGFGHLARALSLTRALGRPARVSVSVRGTAETQAAARRMGARLAPASLDAALRTQAPALVIIDDPDPRAAARALHTSRRHGARVASIHDLGIAGVASDLAIDGSLPRLGRLPARATLRGARYAILDPRLPDLRRRVQAAPDGAHTQTRTRTRRPSARVLISLGGGPRRALGLRIAQAVHAAHPDAHITLAAGFAASSTLDTARGGVRRLSSPAAFRPALARTDVAILGGGVTLYEAAALGVPAVALAVVPAQAPTVRAFAAARAALDAGGSGGGAAGAAQTIQAVVRHVTRLLDDAALRQRMAGRARRLVDGRGAARAAAALRELVISS